MTIRLLKILLPTDFSDYSAAATKYACELATKFDAELHLLHTLETPSRFDARFWNGTRPTRRISTSPGQRRKSPWPVFLIRSGRQVERLSKRWSRGRRKWRSSATPASRKST